MQGSIRLNQNDNVNVGPSNAIILALVQFLKASSIPSFSICFLMHLNSIIPQLTIADYVILMINVFLHIHVTIYRFVQYNPTSLERNYKHELLTETDLGITIDLINQDAYKIDYSGIYIYQRTNI